MRPALNNFPSLHRPQGASAITESRPWRGAIALLCAMAVFIPALRALDPEKSVFQFNCENWTRQTGLPAEKISSIAQTKDGFLWLGTQNGLVRFDGLEFKTVPIDLPQAQGQEVRKLCQASDGGLWFGIQDGGFGHYDGRRFSPLGDARWAASGMNASALMEARDGTVWTGAQLGLGHWMNGKPGESTIDETTTGTRPVVRPGRLGTHLDGNDGAWPVLLGGREIRPVPGRLPEETQRICPGHRCGRSPLGGDGTRIALLRRPGPAPGDSASDSPGRGPVGGSPRHPLGGNVRDRVWPGSRTARSPT